MRYDKAEGRVAGNKRKLCNVKPFVVIVQES